MNIAATAHSASPAQGALTVLHAPRKRLTKAYGRDQNGKIYKIAYDKPLMFRSQAYPVETIDDLISLMQSLQYCPDRCLIMAAPGQWHPGPGQPVRRITHPASELVDDRGRYRKPARSGTAAEWEAREIAAGRLRRVTVLPMFEEHPTRVALLDFDRAAMPAGFEWRDDLPYTAEFLRRKLPPEFHDVACLFYATSSAADLTKPDLGGPEVKMRLGFMLARGIFAAQAKRWLSGVDGLDRCTLNPLQVVYSASPQFLDGLSDPLPYRLGVLGGAKGSVPVPDLGHMPPPKREPFISLDPIRSAAGLGLVTPHPLLDAAMARLSGDAGTVRNGLMQCAFAYASDVGRSRVDVGALAVFLAEVGERHRTEAEVADYGLPGMIAWALEHAPEPFGLTPHDLDLLGEAARSSPAALAIWAGRRSYPKHTTAQFALVAALARGGLRAPGPLTRVLLAFDRRHGRVPHPDYVARTVDLALAAAAARK